MQHSYSKAFSSTYCLKRRRKQQRCPFLKQRKCIYKKLVFVIYLTY